MRKQDVIEYFGTMTLAADALGISVPAVSQWPEIVPELRALQLERVTGGKLRHDPRFYGYEFVDEPASQPVEPAA